MPQTRKQKLIMYSMPINDNSITIALSRIDTHFLIKITDFGLSEDVFERKYFRQDSMSGEVVRLPIKWMALESLSDGHFSEKSDVVHTYILYIRCTCNMAPHGLSIM